MTGQSILRTLQIMTYTSHALQTTEVVFPEHANHCGTLFGGQTLLMMSKAAFLVARQFAGADVVMARCSDAQFLAPVKQGSALVLRARVTRTGRSSMTVCVSGLVMQVRSEPEEVLKGVFEFVAVNAQGRPAPISSLASAPIPPNAAPHLSKETA